MKLARTIFSALIGIILWAGPSLSAYDYGNRTVVVYRETGCSYFIAEGANGRYYIVEWRDGYDPYPGEILLGDLRSGYAEVYYPLPDQKGSVYVGSTYEKRGDVIQKYYDYCGR